MPVKNNTDFFERLLSGLASAAIVLIGVACIIVCLEVFARYFLNRPQVWVFETTEYMLLWITFLATAWVLRKESHVSIDILVNRLNPRAQAILNIITSILSAIACFVIFWYGAQVTFGYYQKGVIIPKTLQLPKSPILAIISVGSLLLFIEFLRRAYRYLSVFRKLRNKMGE